MQPLGDSVPSSLASWPHYDCWANFNDAIGLNEIIVSSANKKAHFGIVRGSVQCTDVGGIGCWSYVYASLRMPISYR